MLNMQDLIESDDIPLHRLLTIALHTAALHLLCSLSAAMGREANLQNPLR